jgi:predicted O-methyltransferase YrrM
MQRVQLPQPTEGYTLDSQRKQMQDLIQQYMPQTKRIMEIGFNAGHSAECFLQWNDSVEVVSFDIGTHNYIQQGKDYIDAKYPGRHTLVLGDSTKTVPEYKLDEPFDVIFIDGGHAYEVARADLENCKRLAHANTLVFMDDTVRSNPHWNIFFNKGPTRAWLEMVEQKVVEDLGFEDYKKSRGMSWGRYRV